MRLAARLVTGLALLLFLAPASPLKTDAIALEQGKRVAPGRLVVAGRRLSCGKTATLLRDFDGFAGHVLVSRHAFDQDWSGWEMHPNGDEIVYLLAGDVDFVLWTPDGERTVRVDRPGSFIIVPKGVWHTADVQESLKAIYITPCPGTEHKER